MSTTGHPTTRRSLSAAGANVITFQPRAVQAATLEQAAAFDFGPFMPEEKVEAFESSNLLARVASAHSGRDRKHYFIASHEPEGPWGNALGQRRRADGAKVVYPSECSSSAVFTETSSFRTMPEYCSTAKRAGGRARRCTLGSFGSGRVSIE